MTNGQVQYAVLAVSILCLVAVFTAISQMDIGLSLRGKSNGADEIMSKEGLERVIDCFLREISFKKPKTETNMELRQRVEDRLKTCAVNEWMKRLQLGMNWAVSLASLGYPFASLEEQAEISVYTLIAMTIDNITDESLPTLERFTSQLVLGQPPEHELLRAFPTSLSSQQRLFGKFGGDMVVKASMEFFSASVLENRHNTLHTPPAAKDWPVYFHHKTGINEAYAFFCFPESIAPEDEKLGLYVAAIPSLMLFIAYTTDILSFYKENLKSDDPTSIIRTYSKIHGLALAQSLNKFKNDAVEAMENVRSVCDPVLLNYINQFSNSFIYWHLVIGRYQLEELDIYY